MKNSEIKVKSIAELTRLLGGLIEMDQNCYMVDWSEADGNPNMLTFGMKVFGDGKKITATPIPTPTKHIQFIQNHEEKHGFKKSTIGFKSWRIGPKTIVTINEYWT